MANIHATPRTPARVRPSLGEPSRMMSRMREHSPGSTSAVSQDEVGTSGRVGGLLQSGSAVSKVRQSILQSTHAASRSSRDPRPVGDRGFSAQCARNVVEFLSFRGFPKLISHEKFLRDPSTKEFFDVFKFLMNLLDPQLEIDGPIDQEVPNIMRRLRYPVEVNKSKLQAISGPATWPQLLAMLDWLVVLVQMHEELVQPVASCQLGLPGGADAEGAEGDHNLLRTIQENYCQYLSGSCEDSHVEKLQEIYQERIRALQEEIYRFEEQHAEMARRLREFDSEHDRLLEIQSAPKQLEMEAERLRGLIQNHSANLKRAEEDIAVAGEEEKFLNEEVEKLRATEQQLQAQIDSQPYSKKDIERLKSERDQMRRMRDALKAEADKVEQDVWELGLKEERVAEDVGRLVRRINAAAETVGSACLEMGPNLGGGGVVGARELGVHANFQASTDVLSALDFRDKHAAAQAVFAAQAQALQGEEAALQEVLEKQRVAQEQVSAKEAECRRLKANREDLAKTREEYRVFRKAQLDDAQRTVDNLENVAQAAAKDITGPSIRDTAEVDELRMTLDAVRTRRADEAAQMREHIRRSQERYTEHKQKVQQELQDYASTMTNFYKEVETAAQKCGEQLEASSRSSRVAPAGGS